MHTISKMVKNTVNGDDHGIKEFHVSFFENGCRHYVVNDT